jgi:hypothetical protein
MDARWLVFIITERKPKSLVWEVWSKPHGKSSEDGGDLLGQVRWVARWRRYAFFPGEGTILDGQCLRDLAHFCQARTSAHRQGGVH